MVWYTYTHDSHISNWNTRQRGTERALSQFRTPHIQYTTATHTYAISVHTQNVQLVSALYVHGESAVALPSPWVLRLFSHNTGFRFYWHTCFHTFAAFFKWSFDLVVSAFIVVAIDLPHLLLHWPYIRAFAHTHKHTSRHVAWLLIIIRFGVFELLFSTRIHIKWWHL